MAALSRFLLALCDLVEAEGRLLRQRGVEAAQAVATLALAFFCLALGLVLLGRGLYLLLARLWGPPTASALMGSLFLALGGGLWWTAGRKARS